MLSLDAEEARRFVDLFKNTELKRSVVITCLTKINKNSPEDDAINCLIVGTEHKMIYILDSEAFTILATMTCPHIPVFLNASGIFDVEYRIIAACRNGTVYTFKRGNQTPKTAIPLTSQIVGIEKSGKNIIIGCMDNNLNCYTTKGKKLWKLEMESNILAMGSMELKDKGIQAVIVSLNNNQVHIYRDKYIITKFKTQDCVVSLKFGKFGREDHNLIMTTKMGGLIVKILKRTAQLNDREIHVGPPEAQMKKLDIPKKTKLYVDQTTRERDNAICKLNLNL
jgi:Bardet-Biedl syndrome 1 protein